MVDDTRLEPTGAGDSHPTSAAYPRAKRAQMGHKFETQPFSKKKQPPFRVTVLFGGRYKTRIQDIACYIVLKCIKIALFASFDELFCPVLFLLLPTCVNLVRLKISKTFGRYIPLTSRVRRTPYSATKTTAVHRRILICQSIITEVNSSINRQSFLYIIFGVFPAYFPA